MDTTDPAPSATQAEEAPQQESAGEDHAKPDTAALQQSQVIPSFRLIFSSEKDSQSNRRANVENKEFCFSTRRLFE